MAHRIAMLSVHTCPLAALGGKETGGMNVYVREISRELGDRGYLVDIFTRSQKHAVECVDGVTLGPNVRVVQIAAGPEQPCSKQCVWDNLPQFVEGVRAFARGNGLRYDLLHSHYWLSAWVAREMLADWPVPIVHMFHTLGHMKNLMAPSTAQREIAARIPVETEIMQFADVIVAATPRDKEQMVELYGADPAKIAVIPCGVDLDLFQPLPCREAKGELGVPAEACLILFVGRIEPIKGVDTLMRALAHIMHKEPERRGQIMLCVIGGDVSDSPDRWDAELKRLHSLRQELDIADVVIFAGAQEQQKLPCYYSAADVVVVPSHYESFGMVALEAMACGKPVVASDVGGLSFIVKNGETGYLVPYNDPLALAEKIHFLLDEPARRELMGIAAERAAQRYSWQIIADEIAGLYSRLLPVLTLQPRSRCDSAVPCGRRCPAPGR
jgi:D-inositol-3-phosphate glycosyltransferase